MPESIKNINYGFQDMIDQTEIMIGGHDVHKVAKVAKRRLEKNYNSTSR